MHLILIPDNFDTSKQGSPLTRVLADNTVSHILLSRLLSRLHLAGRTNRLALPTGLADRLDRHSPTTIFHDQTISLGSAAETDHTLRKQHWVIISNGTRFSNANDKLIAQFTNYDADIIALDFDQHLWGFRENLKLAPSGRIAGFKRLYGHELFENYQPYDWPHHVLISPTALAKMTDNNEIPTSFTHFIELCKSKKLRIRSLKLGGEIFDLNTPAGLLKLLDPMKPHLSHISKISCSHCTMSQPNTRIIGPVSFGRNVTIGKGTVLAGPAIIGDNVTIGENCLINNAIIGSQINIAPSSVIRHDVLLNTTSNPEQNHHRPATSNKPIAIHSTPISISHQPNRFKTWPALSYPRVFKRIADIIAASFIITLIAPALPAIALAIKLNSPGPIFFGHKRQGLQGREFKCLKFRTMVVGADEMQQKLRFCNQVDGPQFKVENDPRVTFVGKFLRDTYLDEVPQFINVLLGHMSIVGPRPSPARENALCPRWRDARLSVRPGVTGLWQLERTRECGHDFQEWIYYDIKYVQNVSLKLDVKIFFKTATKMICNFADSF